ncbi:MAG TPA: FUSC family protein, partial [Nocardioides sp.]|nr:FUSC family protein [Nocardioides sp.]
VTMLWPAPHATWAVLTVSLVVQRDRRSGQVRIFERGVGTAIGVVIAAAFLSEGVPTWAIIVGVVLLGAVRPHVQRANYTSYAALMTPLVVLLTSLGRARPPGLLSARLEYTAAGCLIALLVGAVFDLIWPSGPSAA